MKESTGKREQQRSREELFRAEMKLRSVQRHLVDVMCRASAWNVLDALEDYTEAFKIATAALCAVLSEVKALG